MIIKKHKSFEKDFKKLIKKYRSIESDLMVFLKLIEVKPEGDGTINWPCLKKEGSKIIMKKRMMCRSVKGAQFRVIYYYDGEILELELIEIYYKGDKESEDQKLIEEIWKEKIS